MFRLVSTLLSPSVWKCTSPGRSFPFGLRVERMCQLRNCHHNIQVLEERWGRAKPGLKIEPNLCNLIILVARVIIRDILKGEKKELESEDNWKISFS